MLFTDRRAETRTERVDWPVSGLERGAKTAGEEGRRGRDAECLSGALCRGRDVDCLCGSSRGMGRAGDGQLGE